MPVHGAGLAAWERPCSPPASSDGDLERSAFVAASRTAGEHDGVAPLGLPALALLSERAGETGGI